MRAIIESAPVAGWLLDPSISLETRLKRSCCYRLDSSDQMQRHTHLKQAKINATNERSKTNAYAAVWRWRKTTKPFVSIGGESIPHPKDSFTASLWGEVIGDLDKTLWNYLSASTHGTWYALVQNLELTPHVDLDDTDAAIGGTLIEQSTVTMYAVVGWRACANVVDSRARLMGWPMSTELAAAHNAMTGFERSWFEQWRAAGNRDARLASLSTSTPHQPHKTSRNGVNH